MEIRVVRSEGEVVATVPYNEKFIDRAKQMGGQYTASDKSWTFPSELEEEVRALTDDVYCSRGDGHDDLVDVVLTVIREMHITGDGFPAFGRILASKRQRKGKDGDTSARPGEGVAILMGYVGEARHARFPQIRVAEGTVLRVSAVPRRAVERTMAFDCNRPKGAAPCYSIEVIERQSSKAVLLREKAALEKRLSEIELALAAME